MCGPRGVALTRQAESPRRDDRAVDLVAAAGDQRDQRAFV